MRYLSVCSGIEAATVAWHPLGWEAVAYSEIEPFPSAVLAHHYPQVPNVGDMTKFQEWNLGNSIDLLVGGTPCQSFSVAGLRKGLDDPRGNLALTYCGILDRFRPQWFVWENVPGVLSSNGGRDFGSFLGALVELGYGFAYRVLDAQYFGVAQRRRRVFVVGYLGDWRPAAEVLFERESLRGDPAPRRSKEKDVAGTFTARARSGGWGQDPNLAAAGYMQPVAKCLTAGGNMRYDWETEDLIPQPIALADTSSRDKSQNGAGWKADGTMYTLDTTGLQGVAHCREVAQTITSNYGKQLDNSDTSLGPNVIAFAQNQRDEVRTMNVAGALAAEPGAKQQTYIAFNARQDPDSWTERTGPLDTDGGTQAVGVTLHGTDGTARVASFTDTSSALRSRTPSGFENSTTTAVMQHMAVRRLTPVECERLQGFPDRYTEIPWRKKDATECPDGPRYKALGNSMAVPVMAWIGQRIAEVDAKNSSSVI